MDETLKLLLTILTTIITILLTFIANGVRVIYNKQKDHEVSLSDLKINLEDITEWKERLQREELDSKNTEIANLRRTVQELSK